MEYNRRHVIVVASFCKRNVRRAHDEAVAVFGARVSSFITGNADRYQAFFVRYDGRFVSGECDECAGARQRYQHWLRAAESDEPTGPPLGWIEVKFDNESGSLAVLASSDPLDLTFDDVAVLAVIMGLSVGQLLSNLYAIRALYTSNDLAIRSSCRQEYVSYTSHSGRGLSSLLGSVCPVSTGHLALEFPPGQAFEAARLAADLFQTPCPIVDPVTRVLAGVAFPTFSTI
jgi:hypothetical protein